LKDISSLQFSSQEADIAELFRDVGLRKNTAKLLVLALWDIDFTSQDMERICHLKQPEASIAFTDLIKRKWIKVVNLTSGNMGRPIKIYHIDRNLDEILDDLKERYVVNNVKKSQKIEEMQETLESKFEIIRVSIEDKVRGDGK
jgi:predicted transcriptional regulator